uniref:RNA helicase n=1 Tax=Ditylenchus dipsaci TaxID=166011 RepID=A0A915D0I3_9BILA
MKIDKNFVDFQEDQEPTFLFERQRLPIDSVRNRLREILQTSTTAIFIGETGSGKSTQIPQICLEMNLQREDQIQRHLVPGPSLPKSGIIGVTQPRKVAARSLACRVAKELGSEIGDVVGYKFRFEDRVGPKTKLAYLTDGILLREAVHDAFLLKYSTIIIDEAHERSVHTDVLLYILRLAQKARIDAKKPTLKIFWCQQPSKVRSLVLTSIKLQFFTSKEEVTKWRCIVPMKFLQRMTTIFTTLLPPFKSFTELSLLMFLTGQEEIDLACKIVLQEVTPEMKHSITALPLYSSVTPFQQAIIFQPVPRNSRKIIFATNIAETSITIPGVRIVVDSGKVKQKSFTSQNRVDVLKVVNISKAQAIQRAGRAGREAPGKCYRLYSLNDYEKFADTQSPEIWRTNLSSVVLDLVKMSLRKMKKVQLIDPPDPSHLGAAVDELKFLGAIQINEKDKISITELGMKLDLVSANPLNCLEEALTVVSFLSSETVFLSSQNEFLSGGGNGESSSYASSSKRYFMDEVFHGCDASRKFDASEGDHVRMIKIYRAYKSQVKNNKNSLKEWCSTNGLNPRRLENVSKIRSQLHQLCRDKGFRFVVVVQTSPH